ncbi:hypothetical protein ACO22_04503 [Paracoccidioides brasiliensis]|uniref:Uncharacterized protein n=1 Tax=Paracoccidioides brasiliensis TaxID=121759 RepID=A0A1D2JCW4_PARBR|nr:hypothetical protein ACO22_04503 [Paracoccidioides brasiliensis]
MQPRSCATAYISSTGFVIFPLQQFLVGEEIAKFREARIDKRMVVLTDFFPLLQLTAPCSGERYSGAAIAFGSSDLPRRCTEAVGRSRFMGTGHSLASLDPREILCFSSLYNFQYRPAKAICAPVELNGTA